MKSFFVLITTIIFVVLSSAPCHAHGVDGYIEKAEGYAVIARYDDSEPMSYAGVEIRSPNSDIGFQNGRTDRNGYFMFQPDGQGVWNVVVTDGIGHRLDLNLTLDADGVELVQPTESSSSMDSGWTRSVKIVSGFSIILGLFGFLYGWKARCAVRSATACKENDCKDI